MLITPSRNKRRGVSKKGEHFDPRRQFFQRAVFSTPLIPGPGKSQPSIFDSFGSRFDNGSILLLEEVEEVQTRENDRKEQVIIIPLVVLPAARGREAASETQQSEQGMDGHYDFGRRRREENAQIHNIRGKMPGLPDFLRH